MEAKKQQSLKNERVVEGCEKGPCVLPKGHIHDHYFEWPVSNINPCEQHEYRLSTDEAPDGTAICSRCRCLPEHTVHTGGASSTGRFPVPVSPVAREWQNAVIEKPSQLHQQDFASGASSSYLPRLGLVWFEAIRRIALRSEFSIRIRGPEKSTNALSSQAPLVDVPWLIARTEHAIEHAYAIIQKLHHGEELDAGVDDPGALAWAGAMLCQATVELKKQRHPTDDQQGAGNPGQSS